VEVTESTVAVQTASAEVTTTITPSQVEKLPVLDRQVSYLFNTQAGVVSNGRSATVINGLRPSYSNVLLDGINIQDSVRISSLNFLPNRLTISQIREMTISAANSNPTVGGNASTVVLATPSGTNRFHGDLYWYNRNSVFAANQWFNNKDRVEKPFLNLNQLGGSVGGPIVADKLLFYFNYEAYRLRQSTQRTNWILTPEARRGIFRYRDASGAIQSFNVLNAKTWNLPVDPYMQSLFGMMPEQGNSTSVGDTLNTTGYSFNARSNELRDNITGKLDYYLSTNHSFSGSYLWNRNILDRADSVSGLNQFYTAVPPLYNDNKAQFMSMSWRWSPAATLTNELRGGFNFAPGQFLRREEPPEFFVASRNTNAANRNLITSPVSEKLEESRDVNTWSFQDNANWVKGRHTVAFGFQATMYRVNSSAFVNTVPTYTLGFAANSPYGFNAGDIPGATATQVTQANSLLATVAGLVSNANQTFNASSRTSGFVPGAPVRTRFRFDNYAPYISDTWKLHRRLTVVLGLRWEYFSPVDEKDALIIQPRHESGNPIAALLGNATLDFAGNAVGRPLYKKDLNNFAPNVGFAWDVFGNGQTALRGGYSIAYANDNHINSTYLTALANNGLTSSRDLANLTAFAGSSRPTVPTPPFEVPTTSLAQYNLSPTSPPVQGLIDPNLATPYVQQWNLGIEHSWKGFLLSGRYVGNRVLKQFRVIDLNQININQDTYLQDFITARQNGFLALAQRGTFNPTYNPEIAGSRPLPFFDRLSWGGLLSNATVAGTIRAGEPGTLAQLYQGVLWLPQGFSFFPSPLVLYSSLLTNQSWSNYNSAQFEVTKRMRGGVQLQANYVFSKALGDTGEFRGLEAILDNNNFAAEKARSVFDLTHAFKLNHYVPLPFGRGRRFSFSNGALDRVFGGWGMSGFLMIQSGPPVSILSGRGTLNRNVRSTANTVDTNSTLDQLGEATGIFMTGSGPMFINPKHIGADGLGVAPDGATPFAGQIFFNPQPGSIGSLQRRILSGPWFKNYDFALIKETRLTETQLLEFRADAYNLFNTPNFFVGDQNVNATNFGRLTGIVNTGNGVQARVLQFGLHYRF
jgi:hypothetical protein